MSDTPQDQTPVDTGMLVPMKAALSRLGLTEMPEEIHGAVADAVCAAQIRVAAAYGSPLHRVEDFSEVFYVDSTMFSGITLGGSYRLRLSRAFVQSIAKVETVDSAFAESGTPVEAFKVDNTRGILYVPEAQANTLVRVTYTAGYVASDEIEGWLKEAILGYAPVIFNAKKPIKQSDGAKEMYQQMGEHALMCLTTVSRNLPFLHHPIL